MSNEYVHFNNNAQPAINEDNLNLMQQLIKADITGAVSGDTLPIGAFLPYSGATAPTNWLICDGSAISRTTYQDLFNVIGTVFGAGDGSTTFNLPDMRGRVPVGVDSSQTEFDTLGETGGEKTHTLTVDEMPSHTHTPTVSIHGNSDGITIGSAWSEGFYTRSASGTNLELTSAGGNQPHNILQPYQTTNYIIKAFQTAGVVVQVVNQHSTSTTDVYSTNYVNGIADYSATETRIGTYLGKPLYRKVLTAIVPEGGASNYPIAHNISNLGSIIHQEINCTNNSGNTYPQHSDIYDLYIKDTDIQNVWCNISGAFFSWTAIVILEYTKTTD